MKTLSIHTAPALFVAFLFASGIVCARVAGLPFELLFPFAFLFLSLSVVVFRLPDHDGRLRPLLTVLLAVVIVLLAAAKWSWDATSGDLSVIESNRAVEVSGRIIEPPVRHGNRTRFAVKVEMMKDAAGSRVLPVNILVTVVKRKRDSVGIAFPYGARLVLKGQLARPSAERNPGEFDARQYYEAQGISFLMRVRGYDNVRITDSTMSGGPYDWAMKHVVVPVHDYIVALMDRTIGGEEGELVKGIFVGERSGISYATRNAFANSGISHLLAVSGAHVAVVWGILTMLFAFLRLPLKWRSIATLLCIVLYMLVTGSRPPIVRATIMGSVFQVGKMIGVRSSGLNSLGVAALMILGYDARQLFDVGFQLSFAAVFSLIYLFPVAREQLMPRKLRWKPVMRAYELALVTLIATIGTLPLIALYFGKVSVIGLLTNIVVVPTVGAGIALAFLSSLSGWTSIAVADSFSAVNAVLMKATLWIAEYAGSLSWGYVETLWFRPVHALPFYAGVAVVFHWHVRRLARKFFVAFLISLNGLWIVPVAAWDMPVGQRLRVSFIDVGQGDAALVEFPDGQTMLIDAGPKIETYDAGERIVAPFLKRRGISTIDYLVASHPHSDHIGGFAYILDHFQVGRILESGQPDHDPIYQEYVEAKERAHCPVTIARAGLAPLHIGGASLFFLYPVSGRVDTDTTHEFENINNTSVVCKLCFGETSVLFTGDAEREAEQEMLERYGDFLQSSVLKAGHHGSNTSSTGEFLEAVAPGHAVISVGVNNRFNHPSEEVLLRFRDLQTEVFRTDEDGAVMFESDGHAVRQVEWR